MRITQCQLHNVACFEELTLDFPEGTDPEKADTYLFVGTNGTGKSTILMSLAQAFAGYDTGIGRRLRDVDGYAKVKMSSGEWGGIGYCDEKGHGRLGVAAGYAGSSLGLFYGPEGKELALPQFIGRSLRFTTVDHRFEDRRFGFAAFAYSGQRSTRQVALDAIRELQESPFENALSFAESSNPERLVQWVANTKAKVAFAESAGDSVKAAERREAIARVEQTIAQITGKAFAFTLNVEPFAVGVEYDGASVDFGVLPDGVKSILSWLADLLMRLDRIPWEGSVSTLERPFVLLLDEIELHLHPAWQRKIVPTIQSLFPKAQLFVSTHSPFVVASARDAWVYVLRQENGKTIAEPPQPSTKGASYATVLRDVLDIKEEFAEDVEREFVEFYELRREVLSGKQDRLDKLIEVGDRLRSYGSETAAIAAREIAQVRRALERGRSV